MYVIQNGTLYTMEYVPAGGEGQEASGKYAGRTYAAPVQADIKMDNGKIVEIGPHLDTAGCEVIDASGKIVTPGFVDPHSHVGGFDASGDEDLNEITNPVTAELDAYYGVDPGDEGFRECLKQGITSSLLVPGSANVVCGWGMVLKSAGKDRLLKRGAVMKAAMGINPKGCYCKKGQAPMTRMAIADIMKKYLRSVREYMKKKELAAGDPEKMPAFDLAMEHGIPVLEKKIPLKVHSYMQDMMQLLEIAKEFDILVTMDHAQGAGDFVEELSDPHVKGVIFGPTAAPLFGGEGGKIDYDCCRKLDEAGVKICVMTDGPVSPMNMLIYEMGEAVRKGMDPVRALAMVTRNSSEVLGVEDSVGTLKAGKDADILIWSALPSEAADAVLEAVFVDGEKVL